MSKSTSKSSFKALIFKALAALFMSSVPVLVLAADSGESGNFNPGDMINHHIMDAHAYEFAHGVVLHLPVIVYSEEKGLDIFSSSNFYDEDHNVVPYNGYVMEHEHITLADGSHVLGLFDHEECCFSIFKCHSFSSCFLLGGSWLQ